MRTFLRSPTPDEQTGGRTTRLQHVQALQRSSWQMGLVFWIGWAAGRPVTRASGLPDRVDAPCSVAPVFLHSVRWTFDL